MTRRIARHSTADTGDHKDKDDDPDYIIETVAVGDLKEVESDHKDSRNDQIAKDQAGMHSGADITERGTGAVFMSNLHGDRTAHRHGEVFAGAPDHDDDSSGYHIGGDAESYSTDH